MNEKGKDICYRCGKSQEYGTMKSFDEDSFAIYCDDCIAHCVNSHMIILDELDNYKKMWRTLKAESGYRETKVLNMFKTQTIRELMSSMEGRLGLNKCIRKKITVCMNCGVKTLRKVFTDKFGEHVVCECGSSCDV